MTRVRSVVAVVAAAVTLLSLLSASPSAAPSRAVTFRATDGRAINGLLAEASERPAPAVVLVPMLGRPKEDWDGVAQRLADANITALAIDLPSQTIPADAKALAAWSDDVRAALGFLASRSDVRGNALGIAGASLGASLAALTAATDAKVRSLVLISPALDYRGVRMENAMRQYGARPALLVASHQDYYAGRSIRDLAKNAPGPREQQWSDLGAHGTALLAREPDLVRAIVEWFQRTLG